MYFIYFIQLDALLWMSISFAYLFACARQIQSERGKGRAIHVFVYHLICTNDTKFWKWKERKKLGGEKSWYRMELKLPVEFRPKPNEEIFNTKLGSSSVNKIFIYLFTLKIFSIQQSQSVCSFFLAFCCSFSCEFNMFTIKTSHFILLT